MAKAKRSTPKKTAAADPLARLRGNMRRLQHDAEQLLARTRKQASNLISRDQRRALDRLVDQARRLRSDFEKRAQRAQKEVESRTEKLLGRIEQQLVKQLDPVLRRLDLPTRKEVHALQRRIAQLESRLGEASRPAASLNPEPFPDLE
jgi:poly(hydroxyalkanoate) granule-associated protein